MNDLEKQIDELTKQVQRLADRVSRIEGTFPQGPFGPQFPPQFPTMPAPVTIRNECLRCGIKFSQVMGYVCPDMDCPTGLGGVRCSSGNT